MKKIILFCKILVVLVLLTKLAGLAGIMGGIEEIRGSLSVDEAIADDRQADSSSSEAADPLTQERELLKMLAQREQELKKREEALMREEQRLVVLKQEILDGIDVHRSIMESIRVIDDQQYTDLAKVYEATPPAQAGAMLERLDRRTAAAIVMRMRSRQAGEIWGHLNPDTAASITREITSILNYYIGEDQ